jgi:hypothetical protein
MGTWVDHAFCFIFSLPSLVIIPFLAIPALKGDLLVFVLLGGYAFETHLINTRHKPFFNRDFFSSSFRKIRIISVAQSLCLLKIRFTLMKGSF